MDKSVKIQTSLDGYNFSTKTGFNAILLRLRYAELQKYFTGGSCLEVGCSDGEGTKLLLNSFDEVVAVDGSEKSLQRAMRGINSDRVTFVHSLFERFECEKKFDVVLLAHALEHVVSPREIILRFKRFMKHQGVMIIDVPNAHSIHRQVGVLLGMIPSEYALHEGDIAIGHRRVYDMTSLKSDVVSCELSVVVTGGIFLKPLSNNQLEKIFDSKAIYAFNEIGKRYPEIAAEIYVVCKMK